MIVVCKKYYKEVVLKEIDATATYECVMEDSEALLIGMLDFLETIILKYHHSIIACLCSIGCQSFINSLMVQGS